MSDLSSSIPLKGKVKDENFWKENINLVYEGKFDTDNVHKNFKYAPHGNDERHGTDKMSRSGCLCDNCKWYRRMHKGKSRSIKPSILI